MPVQPYYQTCFQDNPHCPYSLLNAHGFSLAEVLVALVILCLGILGAIKMQLASLQATQQNRFYSTGMLLATDMAEKICSNVDAINLFLEVDSQQSNAAKADLNYPCYSKPCTPTELAHADIAEWLQQMSRSLPDARALICRDSAPWNDTTHSLNWQCSSDSQASIIIKIGWRDKNAAGQAPRIALAVSP